MFAQVSSMHSMRKLAKLNGKGSGEVIHLREIINQQSGEMHG